MFRQWALSGYRFRSRIAALRSYVPDRPRGPLWKYNHWQNALYMSAYHLKASNAEDYIEELIRFRPGYIRAYPSSINVLAEFAYPFRQQLGFVRGIFTASETLLESERANIERTFGKVVYDWYGMTEPAVVITERADHNGLEVNWEYGYPEFQEAPELTGNQRHLLATSLHNPVMPFIRYQTGDIVSLDLSGTSDIYPRIQTIQGRKDECVVTPDGRRLPSLNFYSLLQSYREILRFQFVQTAADEVQLRLLLRGGGQDVEGLLKTLRIEMAHRLGSEMKLRVEITDAFVTSADGKTPTFVRRS
jgi:phenylacetate-CoA ligase